MIRACRHPSRESLVSTFAIEPAASIVEFVTAPAPTAPFASSRAAVSAPISEFALGRFDAARPASVLK